MELYIPSLGDCIRLTADTIIDRTATRHSPFNRPGDYAVFPILFPDGNWHKDYALAQAAPTFTLIKGTVLKFKRYFVSSHAKSNAVEVVIFASPRSDLTPRAQGGKAKQTITLDLTTEQISGLEYEKLDVKN